MWTTIANFAPVGGQVALVLDRSMTIVSQQTDILRVNWLQHRALFDFDWVEVVEVDAEDIERFAVQVGNDTDTIRKRRYPNLPCVISPK